ncbi:MAG: TPM domain-containing protein [Steroidobacteraceae bacterium]
MNLPRITRHLLTTHWQLHRAFGPATLEAIEAAVRDSEGRHTGKVRFAVESALHGRRLLRDQTAAERALEVFAGLHVWDTDHRNGVLIYLLLADRAVEIVVDRAAHRSVPPQIWHDICRQMESEFRAGCYQEGVLQGIRSVTDALHGSFPAVV